jgi:quinolinate synthase
MRAHKGFQARTLREVWTDSREDEELVQAVLARKAALGHNLLVLTHHYQRREIVGVGDYRGDSFDLSQKSSRSQTARHIVFCGVHFMAESAAILAQPHQMVHIPDLKAPVA